MPLSCRACTLVMEGTEDNKDMDTEPSTPVHSPEGVPQIRQKMHDIRISNQNIYLDPPIKDCTYNVLQQLFAWQAFVTSQSTRYWLLTLLIMIIAHDACSSGSLHFMIFTHHDLCSS